jgi:hypothetical protein
MQADFRLVIPYLASQLRVFPPELPFLFEEFAAYTHFDAFRQLKFIFLLQYVRTKLGNVDPLIVIER